MLKCWEEDDYYELRGILGDEGDDQLVINDLKIDVYGETEREEDESSISAVGSYKDFIKIDNGDYLEAGKKDKTNEFKENSARGTTLGEDLIKMNILKKEYSKRVLAIDSAPVSKV